MLMRRKIGHVYKIVAGFLCFGVLFKCWTRIHTHGKVTNIAFLKVHKAGSTTLQNIFFRFGLRNHLNIVLPNKHEDEPNNNYIYSMKDVIPLQEPHTYNIFACHTRYNQTFFNEVVPKGSVKISIVRRPVDRLISAAYYHRDVWNIPYLKEIPEDNFVHDLINHQEMYDKKPFSHTHNAMGKDFGFGKSIKMKDTDAIKAYLDQLNSDFLLVVLMERFDESMVMMKRYLSWSFLDILYLKTNSYHHPPVVLSPKEEEKTRTVNFLDFAIYDYFTEVFEGRLRFMTADFDEEVDYYKALLRKVNAFCSEDNQSDNGLFIGKSPWSEEFVVTSGECELMRTGELPFIKMLKENQFK